MADSRLYPTPEAEAAAQRIRDRYAPRRRPTDRLPPPDPHLILFADGCASWLTHPQPDQARRSLDDCLDRNPPLWTGATIVPVVRPHGSAGPTCDPATGEPYPSWLECPTHGAGFTRED